MADNDPFAKISVLIPVYNGQEFLREALDSIVSQEEGLKSKGVALEVVVVDDGSTDATPTILQEYFKKHESIMTVLTKETNAGLVAALNDGLPKCRGDYIARMDADDVSMPDRFARQYQYLEDHPEIDLVGGSFEIFSTNQPKGRLVEHPTGVGTVHTSLFFSCVVGHPTVFARRRNFLPYDPDFAHAEDYRMWLRMVTDSSTKIGNLPKPIVLRLRYGSLQAFFRSTDDSCLLGLYSKHGTNVSTAKREEQKLKSLTAVRTALLSVASQMGRSIEIPLELVSAFVEPSRATKAEFIPQILQLFELVESFLTTRPHMSTIEAKQVSAEVTARMGELATVELRLTGKSPSECTTWRKWLSRNPADQFQRLMGIASLMAPQPKPAPVANKPKLKTDAVSIVCFSKDRAFQLKEYLRTVIEFLHGPRLSIHVLWKASTPTFRESYLRLAVQFGNQVDFIEETDFVAQLRSLSLKSADFLLWGVDDVFYYNHVSLTPLMEAMASDETILCGHLRLSPNVTYCHPSDAFSILPKFHKVATSGEGSEAIDVLKYDRTEATQDWNYPFELCATLMRKEEVLETLDCIEKGVGVDGLSHPNKLEVSGAKMFTRGLHPKSKLKWCLCLDKPTALADATGQVLSVITINRVQDVCENRVYDEISLEDLDAMFRADRQLDEAWYRARTFNAVHIGDFQLVPS